MWLAPWLFVCLLADYLRHGDQHVCVCPHNVCFCMAADHPIHGPQPAGSCPPERQLWHQHRQPHLSGGWDTKALLLRAASVRQQQTESRAQLCFLILSSGRRMRKELKMLLSTGSAGRLHRREGWVTELEHLVQSSFFLLCLFSFFNNRVWGNWSTSLHHRDWLHWAKCGAWLSQ